MRFNKCINGFKNETEFIEKLNGKKFFELDFLFQLFIEELYPNISKDDIINCYKNEYLQKYDILININNVIKRISIKKGVKNSVHIEPISEFIHFLIENKIPRDVVISYLKYQYADGTTNGSGDIRLTADEYKKNHQQEIDTINEHFNKNNILSKAIDRFILQGRNSTEKIDALIYGVVDDFIWIKRDDIKRLFFKKKNQYSTGVHFSFLTCQPFDRCINRNPKYEKRRFSIQIKWYNLFDDVIYYINEKCLSKRYFN